MTHSHEHGTIALLYPRPEHAIMIERWCKDANIPCVPDGKLHCTLLFSRKPLPALRDMYQSRIRVDSRIKGWKLLGTALVLELDAPHAEMLHGLMISQGGTHDYPAYIPHMTICYEWTRDDLPDLSPSIDIIFDKLSIMGIDPKYAIQAGNTDKYLTINERT